MRYGVVLGPVWQSELVTGVFGERSPLQAYATCRAAALHVSACAVIASVKVVLQYTPGPAPKLITSLGKSVRRSNVRDPPAESRCREQYSVHALQRFGRMCEATGPARHGLDCAFDAWASRLPGSHSGHSAGISLATSSDVSSDLQQEA